MISENFSKAIEKINNNDTSVLQELIKSRDVEIDDEDEHGMTLLQHAAFKGKKDICQLLLDLVSLTMFNVSMLLIWLTFYSFKGADANGGHHEHKYTSLHFAAVWKFRYLSTITSVWL